MFPWCWIGCVCRTPRRRQGPKTVNGCSVKVALKVVYLGQVLVSFDFSQKEKWFIGGVFMPSMKSRSLKVMSMVIVDKRKTDRHGNKICPRSFHQGHKNCRSFHWILSVCNLVIHVCFQDVLTWTILVCTSTSDSHLALAMHHVP